MNSNATTFLNLFKFMLGSKLPCRICILQTEYKALIYLYGALESVLPVYGKRGDKTQTWIRTDLDAGVSEFWVAVISRVDSNTRS